MRAAIWETGVLLLATLVAGCGDTGGGADGEDANGCTNFTAGNEVTFGPDNTYQPACMRVQAGDAVTFTGSFEAHFLVGGTADQDGLYPDPSSPIPKTTTGSSLEVTFGEPGMYPYYCEQHGTIGMVGAVSVQ